MMEVKCSQCGNEFHSDDLVFIKGFPVCAACKPLFLKKLQEGDEELFDFNYKGFWIRYMAKALDGIIKGIGFSILIIPITMTIHNKLTEITATYTFYFFLSLAYYVFFNGKYGATPGKMIINAKIVNADGSPISYQKAFARYFAELVSLFPFGTGYLMAAFDSRKRALHDRICGTMVIER